MTPSSRHNSRYVKEQKKGYQIKAVFSGRWKRTIKIYHLISGSWKLYGTFKKHTKGYQDYEKIAIDLSNGVNGRFL